jgi:hypothetical protein
MKRRAVRATLIALALSGMSYLGQATGGGEGFFPDPSQPAQGAELGPTLFFGGIVWVLAFLPWKDFVKRILKR